MGHKSSTLENALLWCCITRCWIKGILLCTFLSYDQSTRQDIRNNIVKIWKGKNTEEYKITVPILSMLVLHPTKKNTTCKKKTFVMYETSLNNKERYYYGSLKLILNI